MASPLSVPKRVMPLNLVHVGSWETATRTVERYGESLNSAKSESRNTAIEALVKMARGFRNLDNMIALIYLKCSDLVVPLHNRPQPSAAWQKRKGDEANERRRAAEELRRVQVAA